MPLGNERLRKYPSEWLTPEMLEKAIKENPLSEIDVYKIKKAGHYVVCKYKYKKGLGSGLCHPDLNEIIIYSQFDPVEDMKTLMHELLHLTFYCHPLNIPYGLKEKCESIIEKETERIYNESPEHVLKIQKLFKFPKEDVYPRLKQTKLTLWMYTE